MDDSRRRIEPSGMTITDMMVLVIGCAIALSLPKPRMGLIARWPFPNRFGPPRHDPPAWAMRFGEAAGFALRCNLAIALVSMGRCWRWDRVPRPSEWLGIVTGISLLRWLVPEPCNIVIHCLAEYRFGFEKSASLSDLWSLVMSQDLWTALLGTLIGLACVTALIRYREGLPARARTILAIVAAYALLSGPLTRTWGAIYDILDYFRGDYHWGRPIGWPMRGLGYLCTLTPGLTFGIAVIAMHRARRDARSRRWTDRAMFVALMPFAVYSASVWFVVWSDYMVTQSSLAAGTLALSIRLTLVIPLSLLLLRWFRPAWNRRLGLGYDGSYPASYLSET